MKNKTFFYRVEAKDLLSEIISLTIQQRGEWVTVLAVELANGSADIATLDYAKKLIAEADNYREQKAMAGKKGGIAKASSAIAKASSAIAEPSKRLAKVTQKQKQNINPSSSDDDVNVYPEAFERFWSAYPRKVGKGAAYNSWVKGGCAKLNGQLCKAVEDQKKTDQWRKDGGQFIPHPSTWINQRRWEDEPDQTPPDDHVRRNTGLVY